MKLPNGIVTDKETFLGADWSRKKQDVYDGTNYYKFPDLPSVAEAFPNTMLTLEKTAESYELEKRIEAIEAFEKHNVEVYAIPPRWTKLYREEHDIEKSGPNDAFSIREISLTWPRTLCKFKLLNKDPLLDKITALLVEDRRSDCEDTENLAKQYLQNYPPEFREFIMDSSKKNYRKQVGRFLFVAEVVRKLDGGYRKFRSFIGNYAQGYGWFPRSEFYHWWVETVTKARFKAAGLEVPKGKLSKWWLFTDEQRQIHREVLKDANKALRYIWLSTDMRNYETPEVQNS